MYNATASMPMQRRVVNLHPLYLYSTTEKCLQSLINIIRVNHIVCTLAMTTVRQRITYEEQCHAKTAEIHEMTSTFAQYLRTV